MQDKTYNLLQELIELDDIITIEKDWDKNTFTISSEKLNSHVHTGYPSISEKEGYKLFLKELKGILLALKENEKV